MWKGNTCDYFCQHSGHFGISLSMNQCTDGGCSWKVRAIGAFSSSGTKDIEIGVDNDGFIFLGYKAEMDDKRELLWRKDHTEPIDTRRAREEIKNNGYGYSFVTVWLSLFEFEEICSSRHVQVIKSASRHAQWRVPLSQGRCLFIPLSLCAFHTYIPSRLIHKKCCLPSNFIKIQCKYRDCISKDIV